VRRRDASFGSAEVPEVRRRRVRSAVSFSAIPSEAASAKISNGEDRATRAKTNVVRQDSFMAFSDLLCRIIENNDRSHGLLTKKPLIVLGSEKQDVSLPGLLKFKPLKNDCSTV
jgi:hypothetical protein